MQSTEMIAAIASYPDCAHLDPGYVGLLKPNGPETFQLFVWLNHREPEQPTGETVRRSEVVHAKEKGVFARPTLTGDEALYLHMYGDGYSLKDIAKELAEPLRNVVLAFDILKGKFCATSLEDLMAKVHKSGLLREAV
jgi:hypothetical protein